MDIGATPPSPYPNPSVASTNALVFGNDFHEFFPDIGEDPTTSFLIEPLDLFWPAEKDSPQHKFSRALGMLLSISKRQSAAPRSAEDLPLVDAEMLTQLLDILD